MRDFKTGKRKLKINSNGFKLHLLCIKFINCIYRNFAVLNFSECALEFFHERARDVHFAESNYVIKNVRFFTTVMRDMVEEKLYASVLKMEF